MSRQKILDDLIVGTVTASKLTGDLPALDGSALTGLAGVEKGASDPVINTNPASGVGALFLNTTDGELFCCTDATTDANVWKNLGAGSGNISSYYWGGDTGLAIGGMPANNTYADMIQEFTMSTGADASDFVGVLTQSRRYPWAASNVSRVVIGGGIHHWTTFYPTIDYITVSSGADADDFGSQTNPSGSFGGAGAVCDGTRACFVGDFSGTAPSASTIDYITMATTSDAIDFGGVVQSPTYQLAGVNNTTRGVFAGGWRPGSAAEADYITIQTSGNANDFGAPENNNYRAAGNPSDNNRGMLLSSAEPQEKHEYITIMTTSSAVEFGSRSSNQSYGLCCGNGTRWMYGGGYQVDGGYAFTKNTEFGVIQSGAVGEDFMDLHQNSGAGCGSSGD